MDLMIGTVDTNRLRKDLLRHYRQTGSIKSPTVRNHIRAAQEANEQQLIALAKQESMDLRKYIR
jgi:hypothetical protein